jgi:hypothetical protein
VSSLRDILEAFDRSWNPLCLSQLARDLGKPPAVVEGMLATLVDLELLVCLDQLDPCQDCPLQSDCRVLPVPDKVYARAEGKRLLPGRDGAGG